MKKRIVVEIDVPEVSDLCWKLDETGIQAFSETVMLYAMVDITKTLSSASEYCDNYNIQGEQKENFIKYIIMKCEIVQSARIAGYINDDNTFIDNF